MPKQNTAVLVHIVCVLMTGVTSYIFAIIYNICIYAYIYDMNHPSTHQTLLKPNHP